MLEAVDSNEEIATGSKKRKTRAAARQAVILVHGMGEQIPMDTIKGFVDTLSTKPSDTPGQSRAEIWSKPDPRTGSLELRRLTTRKSESGGAYPNGVRSDFFELYWADLTAGSTTNQLVGWVRYLLFRPWSRVPPPVRSAWILLWALALFAVAMLAIGFVPKDMWSSQTPSWLPQATVIAIAGIIGAVAQQLGTKTFGRVVKYTRADPDNIAARKAVRERGLGLLRAIHHAGEYDRVVVVGHSLGSILAYDLVNYFWAEQAAARAIIEGSDAFTRLCALEKAGRALREQNTPAQRQEFRKAQAALRRSLKKDSDDQKSIWLISDLVTFGSPLTHAEFLVARSKDDLEARQKDRELATCPPIGEVLDEWRLEHARAVGLLEEGQSSLSAFPDRQVKDGWTLHHGAAFAVVRWTNVHDHAKFIFCGDLISGPLSPAFGQGIEDRDLAKIDKQSASFTHTRYWSADQSRERLTTFRNAINVLDED